jgi:hypothetical protein
MSDLKYRALRLMKLWCDTLLTYEITSQSNYLDGGLVCPACHVIHGRIADLCYPLTTLYVKTGERKYLNAAEKLIDWSEYNMKRSDGSYQNDAGNLWKGITTFSATALGDCLYHFKEELPPELYNKWYAIFIRMANFCEKYFDTITPNINYYAGDTALLALAWRLTGERHYLEKANHWESFCRKYFDENGLLFGEGHPLDAISEKGCRAIDMGYNLEESLPLLIYHSKLVDSKEKIAFYKARFGDHLEFMLSDGAIDNSFGSRHNKWTYWGSRTSDGIIEGLANIMDEPLFAKACTLAFELYERSTHNGLLVPPMQPEAGEPTCLHHTFCHAKALAALVNSPLEPADFDFNTLLPTEQEYGVKSFQNGNLLLVSRFGWRATINACDLIFYDGADNGGGSMTLLRHNSIGMIAAATMHEYIPAEPLNMQYLRKSDSTLCMTPRIVSDNFSSDCDRKARLNAVNSLSAVTVTASGDGWNTEYKFEQNCLTISANCNRPSSFILPIIQNPDSKVTKKENILKLNGIEISSDNMISVEIEKRCYNQVGGFMYLPIEIKSNGKLTLTLKITG